MATRIEVKVPDIGDFKDIPVIEVLVKPGDTVEEEASLVTLESDKATMDVPSPVDGVVKELKVKVGDKVSEGSLILTVEAAVRHPSPQPLAASGRGSAPASTPLIRFRPAVGGVIEVQVPDIGDFKDVPVIEVLVKVGDTVKPEDALVTLESDKATMDVPSPAAGKISAIKVKVGDKVSEGSVILTLSTDAAAPTRNLPAAKLRRRAQLRATRRPASAGRRQLHLQRQRRRRMRDARAGRGPGRLFRGVPQRRPRDEDGAGRALCDAGRRVPQRRLHSVEGALAHGRGHGRSERAGRARHRLRRAAIDLPKLRGFKEAWSRS